MKTFDQKIRELLSTKEVVEVVFKNERVITGKVSELGEDFVAMTYEQRLEVMLPKTEENKNGDKKTVVHEIETIFQLSEIDAVSRTVKSKEI